MKYKVLKECLSVKQPRWLEPGTIFDGTPNSPRIKALLDRGYIEVIKEPKVELSGQYVPNGDAAFTLGWGDGFPPIQPLPLHSHHNSKELSKIGLSFKMEEECWKWIDKMEAYQILRQDAKGFKPDWKNPSQRKWLAIYNHAYDELEAVWNDETQHVETVYFASEEDLKVSFKKHRKEWLTVLGVEEEK